jgi:hypothetical protein
MPVIRGQWDELLVPGANKVFIDEYPELPALYPKIFTIETSAKAFEDDLVGTGLPIAVSKPEGEAIAFDRPKYRGKVRYLHAGYGLGYEITRESVEDDVYNVLNTKSAANLARSLREAEETTAWNIVNLSFTTAQAYDGVSVCNDAHPGVGSVTNANRPAVDADLSTAALKASMERWWAQTTDRGLKNQLLPEMLMVGNANYWAAQEILQTQFITGAASGGEIDTIISERAVNLVGKLGLTPFRSNYISDVDAWWTLASKGVHKLKFYWRTKPDSINGFDSRHQIFWYGIFARWTAGITDWRGIDGSTGA